MTSSAMRVCMLALLLSLPMFAQTGNQATLQGTVADSSGAVVSGAAVTVTNEATGATFTVNTNADGTFNFAVLPVGTYDMKVAHSGFGELEQKAIPVEVGSKLNLPVTLKVGAQAETVNVSSEAPVIETTRTQLSTTVNQRAIAELPVNGRNFLDFVLLTPAVTRDVRTGDLSFAGQRGTLNSLTVDGADDNNTFFGQTTGRTGSGRAPYQFSQDAVQEFQVNTNGYSAELGHAGGAVVNVITKSGTNNLHGTGFWFYRDRALTAFDPILKQNAAIKGISPGRKPGYHYNQFGGNVGGPIIKNKLFFFADYDGQRNTQGLITQLNIPAIAAPTVYQTAAIHYLQGLSNNYTRGLNQDTYLGKMDWNINSNNQASFRYNRQNFTGSNFENGGVTQASQHTGNSLVNTDTMAATLTSTLSSRFVNVGRFNYQIDNEPGAANTNLPEAIVKQAGISLFTVGRNSFSPRETTIHRQQYADTLTYLRGKHTFKFGADYIHDDIFNYFPGNFSGSYTFNSLDGFGRSLCSGSMGASLGCAPAPLLAADKLTEAFPGANTTGATTRPNINETALFAQDDWHVLSNLTLNLGLRWDLQDSAAPKTLNPIAAAAGVMTNKLNLDTNNFGPRVGFAWTPFANQKTVVRGGYGMFYGRTPSIMVGTAHSNNGVNVGTYDFFGAAMPAYPNTICGAPTNTPNCAAPALGGAARKPQIFFFQPGYQQPAIQQANLSVERQLGNDWSVQVAYLYVKGNHLQRTADVNLGQPTVASILTSTGQTINYLKYPATRPNTNFAQMYEFQSNANSLYHGGTLQVNKRFAQNFQLSAAYTYSHAIDDAPDATAVVPGADDGKELYSPLFPRLDRASSVNDQRHRLVMSGVWQLPYFNSSSHSLLKNTLGGWEISSIFTTQSGQPYTGLINTDLNNDGNSRSERPGNEGRNAHNLPATITLDPRLTKTVGITEHAKLQVFMEAFNLFNRFNVLNANSTEYSLVAGKLVPQTVGVNAFGLPASPGVNQNNSGARIFQLGTKISF